MTQIHVIHHPVVLIPSVIMVNVDVLVNILEIPMKAVAQNVFSILIVLEIKHA